jgi:hypothetical protein
MSINAYSRGFARETRVWVPFAYSFPFSAQQTTDRVVIYGLYSGAYINGQKYLNEVEGDTLINMLADFTIKCAALDQQKTLILAEVASKRYLATLDHIMHDEKMLTKGQELDAETDMAIAKLAALSADEAAMETLALKVETETQKTYARIAELQSQIAIEDIQMSEVEIQIAEKNIQSSKVDIEILNATNAVLKIQIETITKAAELIEVDLKMARLDTDIAEKELQIAKIDLLSNNLVIEQAQTIVAVAEEDTALAQIDLASAKGAEIEAETSFQQTLEAQEAESQNVRSALAALKSQVKATALTLQHARNQLDNTMKIDASTLEITNANTDAVTQRQIDAYTTGADFGRVQDISREIEAAIDSKQALMSVDLVTTLTHTIGKAS